MVVNPCVGSSWKLQRILVREYPEDSLLDSCNGADKGFMAEILPIKEDLLKAKDNPEL